MQSTDPKKTTRARAARALTTLHPNQTERSRVGEALSQGTNIASTTESPPEDFVPASQESLTVTSTTIDHQQPARPNSMKRQRSLQGQLAEETQDSTTGAHNGDTEDVISETQTSKKRRQSVDQPGEGDLDLVDLGVEESPGASALNGLSLREGGVSHVVSEYADNVVLEWLRKEKNLGVLPSYLDWQEHVTQQTRQQIVDTFVYATFHLQLKDDTLFLATQLVDRVMSRFRIQRQRLRSLAFAALHIAAKYVETCPPRIQQYMQVVRTELDKDQILRMESVVLNVLKFEIGFPNAKQFALAWLAQSELGRDSFFVSLVGYLLELSLLDMEMLNFVPSKIAATAISVACIITNRLNVSLDWHWGYTHFDLDECSRVMNALWQNAGGNNYSHVVHSKYNQPRFDSVAATVRTRVLHLSG